jgi:hypothetical protein
MPKMMAARHSKPQNCGESENNEEDSVEDCRGGEVTIPYICTDFAAKATHRASEGGKPA